MLVLSRKLGEKIHIGDGITLTVLEMRGNRVRLGIDAPGDIRVLRAELHEFAEPARDALAVDGFHASGFRSNLK